MQCLRFGVICLVLFFTLPANAAEIDKFIGAYAGEFTGDIDGQESKRDLKVRIEEIDDGFNASWKTTTYNGGKKKTKEYSIDFQETDRDHIYEAAQKKNVFGGKEPLDPMKGDPYFWARIEGKKLTIFAMVVTEDGGYEMQTYDRVLTDSKDLKLVFSRVRDGRMLKAIKVSLDRISSGDY
jgi:hypothetical protein